MVWGYNNMPIMKNKTFYLTTTLPYVNAQPHIGFAKEIVEADVIARYQRQLGKDVFFNTGTDEHGQKIYQKSQEVGISPQEYCDQYSQKFQSLKTLLNLSWNSFVRTTDAKHVRAAQEFWKRSAVNNDIYQADYEVKYCVGCELEKTNSELVEGRCPFHPNLKIEIRKEVNYFFKFSKYQQSLLDLYQKNPRLVEPESKMAEIKSFVKQGLKDFSISRLKEKMPWGIEVPNDQKHVMYVWFDALVSYISALDWPNKTEKVQKYWPGIQLAGKDNLRQQAAMWQAMLMSVGLPNSTKILIDGFISVQGQKMSKSLGNVIEPQHLVDKYGQEATRFLLISLGSFGNDIDVSWKKFDQIYQAQLANSLGNVCSRVAKMSETEKINFALTQELAFDPKFKSLMDNYQLTLAIDWIIREVKEIDLYLSQKKPWELESQEKIDILNVAIFKILKTAFHLKPFMPNTALHISKHFQGKINALEPIFPRVS
jgi:methionyl-tRNA synthetase